MLVDKVAYVAVLLFITVLVSVLTIPFLSRARCSHCGSYNSLDAETCSKCGETLGT